MRDENLHALSQTHARIGTFTYVYLQAYTYTSHKHIHNSRHTCSLMHA